MKTQKIEKRDIFDIQFPENVKSYSKQGMPPFLDERQKKYENLETIIKKEEKNLEENDEKDSNFHDDDDNNKFENDKEFEDDRDDSDNNDDGDNLSKIKYENGKWKFL